MYRQDCQYPVVNICLALFQWSSMFLPVRLYLGDSIPSSIPTKFYNIPSNGIVSD